MTIIGHKQEREWLQKLAGSETAFGRAFLFVGPRSVGKRLVAEAFAVDCIAEEGFVPTPDRPTPLDCTVIEPVREEKRGVVKEKEIAVKDIREALTFLSRFPSTGRVRVLIVDDADQLSRGAQNALLKTLEEPVETAVIILVTSEPGRLLPTVLSRVARIPFHFVSPEEVHDGIAGVAGGKETLPDFFYNLGRPGLVLSALRDPKGFATTRETLAQLFRLSKLTVAERLKLSESLAGNVPRAVELLEWWLPGLRSSALGTGSSAARQKFFDFLGTVSETILWLKTTNANARLVLDRLFLSL